MLAPGVFSPWSTEPPNPSRLNVFAISDTSGIAVRRFGGFVAKYLGDGVLVYFGHPEAHEDDAGSRNGNGVRRESLIKSWVAERDDDLDTCTWGRTGDNSR